MKLTRSEILSNRRKWIDFLKNKRLRKAVGDLDNGNGSRCCLGHGCYALGIKRKKLSDGFVYGEDKEDKVAPQELIDKVGLWTPEGSNLLGKQLIRDHNFNCLTGANDSDLGIQPWEIGEYLETVIEGGNKTPFVTISHYPE